MRVAVVIPSYRGERYIERTLRSLMAQSHEQWTCLVLNDGAEDRTPSIVRSLHDPRIRYRADGFRRGQLRNFNAAILDVLGDGPDIVRLLCADDVLYPHALADAIRIFERHPRVGLVSAHFDVIDGDDRLVLRADMRGRDDLIVRGDDYLVRGVAVGNTIGGPSSVSLRAAALETAGLFDPRIDYSGDSDLWHRVAAGWDIAWVGHRAGLMYRQHEESVTGRDKFSPGRFADKIQAVHRVAATVPLLGGRWWLYQYTIGWLHAINLQVIAAMAWRGRWDGVRVGIRTSLREGLPLYAPFWIPRVIVMLGRLLAGRPLGRRIFWRRVHEALQPRRVPVDPPVTVAERVRPTVTAASRH